MDRKLVTLIVDNQPAARTSLERIVHSRGSVDLLSCDCFLEAASWIKRCRCIDLLLCDVCLPEGMTGVDLAEIAVATHPQIAVVMMSKQAGSTVVQLTSRYGLLKAPFNAVEIHRAIDRVFG